MNVLVTLDSNYVNPLCSMLKSLFYSNSKESFRIFVAHSTLTEYDFKQIKSVCSGYNVSIESILLDDSYFENAPRCSRITKETYYRLFAPLYLPKDVDRILYIDPDTVVINPISSFYNLNFGDGVVAGAGHLNEFLNTVNRVRLKMKNTKVYVNAGVLLMNIEKLRENFDKEAIFDYISKNKKWLFQADQDVINAMYDGKIVLLNEDVINLDDRCFTRVLNNNTVKKAYEYVNKHTMIVHFDGKNKPWKTDYNGNLLCYYAPFGKDNSIEEKGIVAEGVSY